MSFPSRLGNFVFELLPHENRYLYRFCRKVFHRANADNDDDIRTNGERVLMQRVLPKATIVFDAGANVGDWTAEALSINSQAHYHLFEPSPTTFGYLQRRSFPANVTLNNTGLGAAEGEMDLFIYGDGLGANSLYDRRGTDAVEQRREPVRITTLDAYCAGCNIERIDFLKIDVEGHELQVLRGAAELLRAGRIGVIQFEYGGTYIDARGLFKDVWDLIGELDPQRAFFKLHRDGPRHVAAYRQELETFQYSNWVIATNDEIEGLQSR
jgi:FkbM family methyltransferase